MTWLRKLARIAIRYSLSLRVGQVVVLAGPPAAQPLLNELTQEALACGAIPVAYYGHELYLGPTLESLVATQGSMWNPCGVRKEVEVDATVVIWTREHRSDDGSPPSSTAKLSPATHVSQSYEQDAFFNRAATGRVRWLGLFYPTQDCASDSGLSFEEVEALVVAGGWLDQPEPLAAWQDFCRGQEQMTERLAMGRQLKVVSRSGTDLSLSVDGRRWVCGNGYVNWPDGEVFVAPRADSVEGRFVADYPVVSEGIRLLGVCLELERGQVVRFEASEGRAELHRLLTADAGARRVGEFGIGTNHRMCRGIGMGALDEKQFGTCHVGIGRSPFQTDGDIVSAVHRDFVSDLRQG